MSDADRDVATASIDGVTVRKTVDTDRFDTLAVVFEITSDADESRNLLLVDNVPEDIPLEDIGFHPDYEGDHWTRIVDHVAFGREIEPGEEYTTIYGVRNVEEDDADRFTSRPEIELVEAPDDESAMLEQLEEIDRIISKDSSQAVRDIISGEADVLPERGDDLEVEDVEPTGTDEEGEETVEADEESPEEGAEPAEVVDAMEPDEETADATEAEEMAEPDIEAEEVEVEAEEIHIEEPTAEEEPGEESEEVETAMEHEPEGSDEVEEPTEAETAGTAAGEDQRVPSGGVVRVLVKELKQGNVDEEDREYLQQELVRGSTEARIEHLQNEVSDLRAYTDALEDFLDEEGTGRDLLDDINERLSAVEHEADRIEDGIEANAADVEGLRDDIEDVRGDLRDDVEGLRDDIEGIRGDVGAVRDDLDELDEVESGLAEVQDDVAAIEEDLDGISDLDARLSDVEGAIDDIHDEIEELNEFRDRLTMVFERDEVEETEE